MIVLPAVLANAKDSSSVFFVDLYILHLISGDVYFAACDEDIPWFIPGAATPVEYKAQAIQRGNFSQHADDKIDNMDILISNVTEVFSSALYQSFDFRGTYVDIYQIAYPGSLTDSTAFKHTFHGFIDTPGLDESKGEFTATLIPQIVNLQSCRTMSLTCNAWFGDPEECGATKNTATSTVGANTTQTVIYDSGRIEAENYWKSGVITIGFESKKIIASTNGSITVEYPFFSTPTVGTTYTVENGCDQSYPDCTRHNNTVNFGGFKAIPYEEVVTD